MKGFSYLGLLIMLAVMSIVAAASVTTTALVERRWAEEELLECGEELRTAIRAYYLSAPDGVRRYPASLAELLRDSRFPGTVRHLRKVPVDPLTGRAEWGVIAAPTGGVMGVYSLASGVPIKIAEFGSRFPDFDGAESYSMWRFLVPPS